MRYFIRLAVVFLATFTFLATASAEKRVALVIGNAAYGHHPKLPNVPNDAAAMAALFKAANFDAVVPKENLGVSELRKALREFSALAAGADMAVVYFAGHGIEVDRTNYLIPVDAKLATDIDVEDETVSLDRVLQLLEPAKRLRLVILDACRENPFAGSIKRTVATRTIGRGLGRFEPTTSNTLIAFATKSNAVAEDGKGANSPFTAALLKHLPTPGLDVILALRRARDEVLASTRNRQEPYFTGSLGGDIVSLAAPLSAADAKLPVVPAPLPLSAADRVWVAVKDTTSIPALEAFRQQYGKENPVYDRLAEARIEGLRRQQLAMLEAEQARKLAEEEKKRAEAHLVRPGRVFRDCPDMCPEMVVLPAGEFTMGSNEFNKEWPAHKVTIARPFAVGKFEVTFAEWDACGTEGGCKHHPDDQGWGRGRRPVVNVSWHDAKAYVAWLSRKTGKIYRLLSEAEWEYAARAGTTTQYASGNAINKSQAQFSEGGWGSAGKMVEVGSFPANKFKLHDLHGNVWEWVEDSWHPNYQGAPIDGSVWQGGDMSLRVLRGGGWYDNGPDNLRSANRYWIRPDVRGNGLGFRVARTL